MPLFCHLEFYYYYIRGAKRLKCLQHEILQGILWVGFMKQSGKVCDVWISGISSSLSKDSGVFGVCDAFSLCLSVFFLSTVQPQGRF